MPSPWSSKALDWYVTRYGHAIWPLSRDRAYRLRRASRPNCVATSSRPVSGVALTRPRNVARRKRRRPDRRGYALEAVITVLILLWILVASLYASVVWMAQSAVEGSGGANEAPAVPATELDLTDALEQTMMGGSDSGGAVDASQGDPKGRSR